MAKAHRKRISLPLYLIPIVLGMSGVLFARQFEDQTFFVAILLTSVAAGLFAGGNVLARLRTQGYERYLLVGGLFLLAIGAMTTAFELSGKLVKPLADVPESVSDLSHWLGLVSLLVGICAVLFIVIRREEATEEIGERFRHLAEHMSEGFIFVGSDGIVVLVNKALSELTGIPEEELIGKNAREMAEELDLKPMLTQIDNRAKGLASEYRLEWHKDGQKREFLVSGTPVFDGRGRLAGHLATFRDMTEQFELSQRIELYTQGLEKLVDERTEQLDASQERLRDLLVHMNEGFMTVDAAFRVHFANERLCQVIQGEMREVLGRDLFDFVEPVSRGRLLELFELAKLHQGQRNQGEINLIRPSGALVSVVVAIAAIQNAAEGEPCYSLVVTDVSELKKMQVQLELRAKELESVNEELRMLDRAKDSFLTNVSHELRTPLSTVRGYVEMLQSDSLGSLEEAQAGALRVMMRNIERLQTLIEEMIDFSRMVIRGVELSRTLFSVRSLLQECVASAGPQMKSNELTPVVEVPDDFPPLWGDRKRLTQVVTILLSNAIKFSHRGGAIRLYAEVRPDHTTTIAVADSGIGIERAYQNRIFDKFFQVDNSLARRYEGAGIGLSIAKSLTEAHGGDVELESQPNQGSTFTIVLPDAAFQPEEEAQDLKDLDILLLSEEQEFIHALENALVSVGCSVSSSANGHEAIRLASEAPPDVILIDEALTDMAGEATLAKLTQQPVTMEIPVVLLSGDAHQPRTPANHLHDAVRLQKPFSADALLARIRQRCYGEDDDTRRAIQSQAQPARECGPFVLAVDSDSDLLEWLEAALTRRGIFCACAPDIEHALNIAARRRPDIVLLNTDITNGADGPSLEEFRKAEAIQGTVVYLMTGLPDALPPDLPVAGVLQKPFSIDDVTEALRKKASQTK